MDAVRFSMILGKLGWMKDILKSADRETNNPGAQAEMNPEELLLYLARDPEQGQRPRRLGDREQRDHRRPTHQGGEQPVVGQQIGSQKRRGRPQGRHRPPQHPTAAYNRRLGPAQEGSAPLDKTHEPQSNPPLCRRNGRLDGVGGSAGEPRA